jgi:hypothetical protein
MTKSLRNIIVCGVGVLAIALAYFIFCWEVIGSAWQRKEGDLPPISPVLESLGMFAVIFPFGCLGVDSILILPIVNGLFWGVLLVAVGQMLYSHASRRIQHRP